MIGFGRGDQFRVGIDADHVMADRVQVGADATRTAPRVEDPGVATDHRIDEPALAGQIGTVGLHGAEPLDVPLAVPVLRVGHPSCRHSHTTSVRRLVTSVPGTNVTSCGSWTAIRYSPRQPRPACRSRSSPAIPTSPT